MADTIAGIEQSWSKAEVCAAWRLSPKRIDKLITAGEIGYYRAGRSKRFLAEHLAQIRAAIEVKPTAVTDDDLRLIGATTGTRARRRTRSQA